MRVPRFVKRTYRDARDQQAPRWTYWLSLLFAPVIAIWLVVHLLTPDHTAENQHRADQWNQANAAPTAVPGDDSPAPDSSAGAGDEGTTTPVQRSDGSGPADVPLGALD